LAEAEHITARTQRRLFVTPHPPDPKAFIARRLETGSTKREALRLLKRKLANIVYRTFLTDAQKPARADAA
jgi:hypothetical protein